ncbi:MAG: hypothetical protein GX091_05280 [Peptococcaceae bacterium]|nr:hypothetical protein [Peptococcaceae bacterium]
MGNSGTGMKEKLNKFFHSGPEQKVPSETETLKAELRRLIDQINRSWNNFLYANDNFVDIAVMEIYNNEMRHSILYHKMLELNNKRDRSRSMMNISRDYLPWLKVDPDRQRTKSAENTENPYWEGNASNRERAE